MQSVHKPHECMRAYSEKLGNYDKLVSNYEAGVKTTEKLNTAIEEALNYLETVDSKIINEQRRQEELMQEIERMKERVKEKKAKLGLR